MLNKYLERLVILVDEYRKQELSQFCGPDNKEAQWNDLIWYHIDPNTGRKVRFLCGKLGLKGKGSAGNRPECALRYPYDQLIKVWIIEVNNKPVSAQSRQTLVLAARRLFSKMQGELYSQTPEGLVEFARSNTHPEYINHFFEFCAENGLMPRIRVPNRMDDRDRTGHAQFDARVEKLPDVEAIMALGAIHQEIFRPVSQSGSVSMDVQIKIMDAVTSTAGLLGLASPSRIAAEVPLVPKQKLKKYSEGGKNPVHYLDWPGSKGFKDNHNHILAVLADEVDRAVNFFCVACEPARILCRFYENPKETLVALLGDFKVSSDRRKHLQFDKTPNLFVLGYALGFYGVNASVRVALPGRLVPKIPPQNFRFRSCFYEKPIHALDHEDRIAISATVNRGSSGLSQLMGYIDLVGNAVQPLRSVAKPVFSIGELQDNWIRYFTTRLIPEFPYSYATGEGKVRLADALFCILGSHFYGLGKTGSSGRPLAKSFYNVVPLNAIASKITQGFRGRIGREHIFEKYGFAGLNVKPHSLRHFGNTLAELSEIPREIITAWSGRKDKEQTETYLHRSHQEQADRVRAVLGKPEHDRREIRVVAREAISQTTNLPASITSSGICTQEINLNPCDFLNDFVSQCFMCSAACHIAGDPKAIQLFEKDHEVQIARLGQLTTDRRLHNSSAMQRWFIIHSRNTYVLASLHNLMKTLTTGTVIRYSPNPSEFHITDMSTKKTIKHQCLIPDFESKLRGLLAGQYDDERHSSAPELESLLASFGLSEGAE